MKTIVVVLSLILLALSVVGGVLLVKAHRSAGVLQTSHRKLEKELEVVQALADALRSEKQETQAQLARAQDSVQSLQSRLAESESARTNATNAPPTINPYRVPTYLGRTLLGQATVIPRNLHLDTNLHRYVYEPVVVLDESFRDSFVSYVTNVVEREVPVATSPTYVENNYIAQSVSTVVGPVYPRGPDNSLRPRQPPPPTPPPKFNPGNGTVTPQRLGTPVGDIKTRPQVPMTAPNSRP